MCRCRLELFPRPARICFHHLPLQCPLEPFPRPAQKRPSRFRQHHCPYCFQPESFPHQQQKIFPHPRPHIPAEPCLPAGTGRPAVPPHGAGWNLPSSSALPPLVSIQYTLFRSKLRNSKGCTPFGPMLSTASARNRWRRGHRKHNALDLISIPFMRKIIILWYENFKYLC